MVLITIDNQFENSGQKKSKTSEKPKEKAPRKSRRSSIRFDKNEQVHEIPSRYELNEQRKFQYPTGYKLGYSHSLFFCSEESDGAEEAAAPSTSRRTSIASSARTLDRRGSDDESEDDTIVIDRRKGFKSRKVENAQECFIFSSSGPFCPKRPYNMDHISFYYYKTLE